MICHTDISSSIGGDEVLYRAVGSAHLVTGDDGTRRISSSAFNDRGRRPSVDRANLCSRGPVDTRARLGPDCGVLSLVTSDVRGIAATHGATGVTYGVDVEPAPLPGNAAHAEIVGKPPFDTDRVFDRIKQALARLAIVALEPG